MSLKGPFKFRDSRSVGQLVGECCRVHGMGNLVEIDADALQLEKHVGRKPQFGKGLVSTGLHPSAVCVEVEEGAGVFGKRHETAKGAPLGPSGFFVWGATELYQLRFPNRVSGWPLFALAKSRAFVDTNNVLPRSATSIFHVS